jgi:hypothetical protein
MFKIFITFYFLIKILYKLDIRWEFSILRLFLNCGYKMGVLTIWWWIFIGYQCKTKTKLHWLPLNSIYKSINHYMQYKNSNFVTNFKATFRPTTSTSFKFRFNELWLTEQLGIKKWQSREHKINIIITC